ncbi:MAG: hypothetical protein KJ060_13725, partial [Candidatus Hydrogenedentes bacterium]|nr:hypothetical protein [Candidatus Hydrogenedentota bacterium]
SVVVRGYETSGKKTNASIAMPGLKKPVGINFGAHEIKTLRVARTSGKVMEIDLLEEPVK